MGMEVAVDVDVVVEVVVDLLLFLVIRVDLMVIISGLDLTRIRNHT